MGHPIKMFYVIAPGINKSVHATVFVTIYKARGVKGGMKGMYAQSVNTTQHKMLARQLHLHQDIRRQRGITNRDH